jgi:epoxyqueuosine reductase
LEKAWAKKSGLGWIGKNGNLITQKVGSFYFLGEIILDLELDYDGATTDHCGTCTRCIDACPTEAIVQPYVVDGSKCISYLTIELKDQFIPVNFLAKCKIGFMAVIYAKMFVHGTVLRHQQMKAYLSQPWQ